MTNFRIHKHPILSVEERRKICFQWQDQPLEGREGDTISAALIANGINVFGHHPKDGSPQGIFCANGQCSQCMVIADGIPVKACMELLKENSDIHPLNALPTLPEHTNRYALSAIREISTRVLIIGGGPAGLSAALELGRLGVNCILVDDKHRLGGKLVLQTHRFFGSVEAVFASTRGIDIGAKLEQELREFPCVKIWTHSTALAVFSDKKIGVLKDNAEYILITAEALLVTAGAREKFLTFPGNTLPGVFGAGAFQTLVNRDLVRPSRKLFIVGGGNVGLIAGYHALQADIAVVGLAEALPECGGYKVHEDKLARLGVPIYTSHTILSANGKEKVESVTIAKINDQFQPIPGTEKTYACDSILIAVGLDPVNELFIKAKDFDLKAFVAGDAEEIAEASAAIFSGRIRGIEIAQHLGFQDLHVPDEWYRSGEILKSRPGVINKEHLPHASKGVLPVIHCVQEIPCNPCSALCSEGLIQISKNDIRDIPKFVGNLDACKGCLKCVIGCPGLAITLVDYRRDAENPTISIPLEFGDSKMKPDDVISVIDMEGGLLGDLKVKAVRGNPKTDHTTIVQIQAPADIAEKIAGIKLQDGSVSKPVDNWVHSISNDTIVCRCERVTAGEIREVIRQGVRDVNEIKAVTRAGMGACGAKTCTNLIQRIFREEGISPDEVREQVKRPLFVEVPLGTFAGVKEKKA